ncbi:MAG TPA: pilus assembly protein PilM [Pirellulales bacterium]|jgi:type IV pilus assembly protein PilM|nr:pilus assembly protein PilM [Pirellulales bacterium]
MIRILSPNRAGPIGIDIGSRSIKLLQLNADRTRVLDAARRDLSSSTSTGGTTDASGNAEQPNRTAELTAALRTAREGRSFRGREAVICLGARELFVQNVRLPKAAPEETARLLEQEAASRLPFPYAETESRFLEAADVRQGEAIKREVILLACHRPALEEILEAVEAAGLKPIAVDAEPLALLRCYSWQFRRDEDRQQRTMFVHMGATSAAVIIARGTEPLFIKYIDIGGQHLDEVVAAHLKMDLPAAAALRRHNGDRRSGQQDPEIARSIVESTRPVIERLANELAMCVRYHSVTFRGQPISRLIVGGGEAAPSLVEELTARLDLKCELGDPLRSFELAIQTGRRGQWDLAVGMALRERVTAVA